MLNAKVRNNEIGTVSPCGGQAPQQRAEIKCQRSGKMREIPESGWGFESQDVGGELVMRRKCPEFGRDGDGRKGGVKAVEGYRSPCPGGITQRLELYERSWGLRRKVSEADGGLMGMYEIPELGWSFESQDVGGELVMRRKCPEFSHPKIGFASRNWFLPETVAEEGYEVTRRRVARAGHALTGLVGFIAGLTWAFARRTRSSPGYHMGGLQPRQCSGPVLRPTCGTTPVLRSRTATEDGEGGLHPVRQQRGDSGPRTEDWGQIIPESRMDDCAQYIEPEGVTSDGKTQPARWSAGSDRSTHRRTCQTHGPV